MSATTDAAASAIMNTTAGVPITATMAQGRIAPTIESDGLRCATPTGAVPRTLGTATGGRKASSLTAAVTRTTATARTGDAQNPLSALLQSEIRRRRRCAPLREPCAPPQTFGRMAQGGPQFMPRPR